jgi:ABC-2 type transport system permease protein
MQSFVQSFQREIAFLRRNFWDRAIVIWLPLMLCAVFTAQLGSGVVRSIPVVVVDQDMSGFSRQLTLALDASPTLEVVASRKDLSSAQRDISARDAYGIILIPDEADERLARGDSAPVILYYNASFSAIANSVSREFSAVTRSMTIDLALRQAALPEEMQGVRSAPITVSVRTLFNPYTSYELYLLSFIHPGILHLLFMVAVTSSLGRELRDGTIGEWLGRVDTPRLALAGKLAPYFIAFMFWGMSATLYLAVGRGFPIQGNLPLIMMAYFLMYLAYASVSLLFVGTSRSMIQALSFTGVFAGLSVAFADTIFPLESASVFGQIWGSMLPFTWFTRALYEQWIMGSDVATTLPVILVLLIFLIPGPLFGLRPYLRAANQPETWGKRV